MIDASEVLSKYFFSFTMPAQNINTVSRAKGRAVFVLTFPQ